MSAGRDVTFPGPGATLCGHLVVPAGAVAAGLVLVPDVRGLSDHYRDVARRFAGEGFATLALDPYSREGAPALPDMAAVFRWLRALPDRRVLGDVAAAVDHVATLPELGGGRVGVTG